MRFLSPTQCPGLAHNPQGHLPQPTSQAWHAITSPKLLPPTNSQTQPLPPCREPLHQLPVPLLLSVPLTLPFLTQHSACSLAPLLTGSERLPLLPYLLLCATQAVVVQPCDVHQDCTEDSSLALLAGQHPQVAPLDALVGQGSMAL